MKLEVTAANSVPTAQRLIPILASLVIVLGSTATSAQAAVPCGAVDPMTKRPTQATLTLAPDSVTSIAYKRDTAPATLLLRFKAKGCELPATPPNPDIEVLPKQGAKEIPHGVVSLTRARVDGAEYSVRATATPKNFKPGSYQGSVEVRAPYLATARAPISLSRSEDNFAWPMGIGATAGLAGLIWFLLLKFAKGATTRLKKRHYAIVLLAAAAAGVASALSSYLDQEVWTLSQNGFAAALAAFTGATTGAMATAIGVLWKDPAEHQAQGAPAVAQGQAAPLEKPGQDALRGNQPQPVG